MGWNFVFVFFLFLSGEFRFKCALLLLLFELYLPWVSVNSLFGHIIQAFWGLRKWDWASRLKSKALTAIWVSTDRRCSTIASASAFAPLTTVLRLVDVRVKCTVFHFFIILFLTDFSLLIFLLLRSHVKLTSMLSRWHS